MIKGSIQEEDITIINIYAPNIAPQYVRQMLTSMKGESNNNTIIAGDFNTPLTSMDRSTKQKINKDQTQRTNIKSNKGKTTNNIQGNTQKVISLFLNRNCTSQKRMAQYI